MKAVWRYGFLYLLALLLLLALGQGNQAERARIAALREQLAALEAKEEALLREGWEATRPHRVLEWAEREGFVPMSQGRWAR